MGRGLFLAVLAVAVAGCAQPGPAEFAAKEHRFKARFGSPPRVSAKAKSTVYAVEAADGALTVTVTELPIPDGDPADRGPLYLVSARDDLIRAALGTQTADASATLAGKYPGRAFAARFTAPRPGVLRARIFLVGKRLYQVMAIGTEEYANAPAATAFLESFQLTE